MHKRSQKKTFYKIIKARPSYKEASLLSLNALDASEATTAQATALVNSGKDAQLLAAQAKIDAVTAAQKHLPELLQLMGAEGLRPEYVFCRHIAAAQSAGFTDGATNILKDRVDRLTGQKGP